MKERNQKADAVIVVLALAVLVLLMQLMSLEAGTKLKEGLKSTKARKTFSSPRESSHTTGEPYFNFKPLPAIILKTEKNTEKIETKQETGSSSTGSESQGSSSSENNESEDKEKEEEQIEKRDYKKREKELDIDTMEGLLDFDGTGFAEEQGEEEEEDSSKGPPKSLKNLENAAILILAYNRPESLQKTVDKLMGAAMFTDIKTYISIDGSDPATVEVIDSFSDRGIHRLDHPRKVLHTISKMASGSDRTTQAKAPGTMYLAAHYKWALNEVLKKRGHSHAIIIEDDMLVSKDFISLFEQTAPLLDKDPSLWCVSSWNDNGYKQLDLPDNMLFRTSFFPGLGWMLKKELWEELSERFPADQWDHWMRVHTTSKGRECVVPFKSRNYNIGSGGANSNPQFFRKYLQNIASYDGPPVRFKNVPALGITEYTRYVKRKLAKATYVQDTALQLSQDDEEPSWADGAKVVAVPYYRERYDKVAKQMGLYPTLRCSHRYANIFYYKGVMVILMDKRLSPYLPDNKKSNPVNGLKAVAAGKPGVSCNDVCEGMEGGWECSKGQFDYVNQCRVLQKMFGGCQNGCRRDWGKDIPNFEHIGDESQFGGHQCLVTEEIPTCEARHPKTERVCPCIPRGKAQAHSSLVPAAAKVRGQSCNEVCTELSSQHRCDESQFHFVNTCQALKAHFDCTSCEVNQGKDIPNFVSHEQDANHGRCLTQRAAPTCDGSHKNTQRLCPCVLKE